MRKVDDGEKKEKKKEEKRMAFLGATTSLPAVYRPNGYARTTTAGTLHARANSISLKMQSAGAYSTVSCLLIIRIHILEGVSKTSKYFMALYLQEYEGPSLKGVEMVLVWVE